MAGTAVRRQIPEVGAGWFNDHVRICAGDAGKPASLPRPLVLLRAAERRLGLAGTQPGCIREWRDPARAVHTLPAMLGFRMFAIARGYEDADDCDDLPSDPLFKLAVGRAPESGRDLCSQPTMSRLKNAPSRVEVGRLTAALVDIFCRSFAVPPAAITLDIDDTCDPVHGHQQLSLFNGFYDMRYFLPVHVYHVESGKPVAVLLRPGKTPSGVEVRAGSAGSRLRDPVFTTYMLPIYSTYSEENQV